MESINQDIKTGKFNRIYLLYGEESYLRNSCKNKLKDAIVPPDDSVNISEFTGNGADVNEIINAAVTMPFFADRRVVIVSDTNLFTTSQDELSEFLANVPETTVLIFNETNIDKKFKLYKACAKYGRVVEFKRYNESSERDMDELKKRVVTVIAKNNKKISYSAMDLFLSRTGVELEHVFNELEKLLCYTYDKDSITDEDVIAVVPERLEDKIFEMIDSISSHNQTRALDLYYDLLRKKEAPVKILTLIARHFNQIYIFKNIYDRTGNQDEALKLAKIPAFKSNAYKYRKLADSYSNKSLENALNMCLDLDKSFKSGKIKDNIAVELVIVKMSQKSLTKA